jgi:pilus assembly protein Flp/PilA
MFARFFKDESGATAIEYGLIAAATGLALVAVMPSIKAKLNATFTSISTKL